MHPQIKEEIKASVILFQDYSNLVSGDCVFDIRASWVKGGSTLKGCLI